MFKNILRFYFINTFLAFSATRHMRRAVAAAIYDVCTIEIPQLSLVLRTP